MNKKAENEITVTILIILISVIVIFSLYHLSNSSPKFTITQEVCHNETNLLFKKVVEASYYQGDSNISSISIVPIKDVKVKTNGIDAFMSCNKSFTYVDSNGKLIESTNDFYYLCSFYVYEKKCEQKEVEYMYIKNQTLGSCSKWLNLNDGTTKCIGKQESWQEEIWYSSKDLTTEWLFTNCIPNDCLTATPKENCIQDSKITVEHSGFYKGFKFTCGTYEVTKNG